MGSERPLSRIDRSWYLSEYLEKFLLKYQHATEKALASRTISLKIKRF